MKKILLSLALAAAVAPAFANDYTDNLVVTINQLPSPAQQTTITVDDNNDGTYNFSLKDFSFGVIKIGDLNLDSIAGVKQDGEVYLAGTKDVHINLYGVMPLDLPVTLRAELLNNQSKLYASMDIPVTALGQTVNVIFGGGYQVPNGDFESFHKATIYDLKYDDDWNPIGVDSTAIIAQADEPNAWHSFQSATGLLANLAGATPHIFKSDKHHGGSYSVMLKSSEIFGIVANGTMTTGRMNAAAVDAADPANHAWLDMDSTGTDGNGDPFYTAINGLPDSLAVWVNYNQANPSGANATGHPYATVSAAITDGTYYQDPLDKEYTNVLATAKNNTIEATGDNWQRIVIPFNVVDKSVKGKAVLITISTNADAGKGSDGDSIYVDDLSFIYNDPQNVNINWGSNANGTVSPDDITVTWDDANGARVVKSLKQDGNNVVATVTVYNGDLTKQIAQESHTYANATTGISNIKAETGRENVAEIYDINGRRVNSMYKGGIFIIKTTDGKTFKIAK